MKLRGRLPVVFHDIEALSAPLRRSLPRSPEAIAAPDLGCKYLVDGIDRRIGGNRGETRPLATQMRRVHTSRARRRVTAAATAAHQLADRVEGCTTVLKAGVHRVRERARRCIRALVVVYPETVAALEEGGDRVVLVLKRG